MRISGVPLHRGHYLGDGSAIHEFTASLQLSLWCSPTLLLLLLLLRVPWHVLLPGKRAKSAHSLEQQHHRTWWQMQTQWEHVPGHSGHGPECLVLSTGLNKEMLGFHHEDVFCSTWTLQGCSKQFRTAAPPPWAAGSAHNNQENAEQGCTNSYQQQRLKQKHFSVRNNFISLRFPDAKSLRAKSNLNKLSAPPVLIVSPTGWGNL